MDLAHNTDQGFFTQPAPTNRQPESQQLLPVSETSEATQTEMGIREKNNGDGEDQERVINGTDNSPWTPNFTETMILLTMTLLSVMVSLDATIIVTSLATIVEALNLSATQGFWIGTSYLLVVAVTMPFTASISDIFGRPQTLFVCVVSFTVGSVLCAVSHSLDLLIVGRCLQGIGGGGIIVLANVILSDVVPLKVRPKYLGFLQAGWALGTVTGPMIGGAFAHPHQWRWVFWLMLPFCGIGLVSIPLFIRLERPQATLKNMLSRVDWIGGFVFISSATSFLIAISWGGSTYAWDSWRTLVPLIVGILGLIGTMFYERYIAKEPFLKHSLFQDYSAHAIYIGAFLQGLLLYGDLYYLVFFFQAVKLYSSVHAGVSMLPILVTVLPAAVIVGVVITRTQNFRWAIISGWILATLGTGLTISWDRKTSTAVWVVESIILGCGHGLLLNALNTGSQATCKAGDEGRAVGMYVFQRSFGMAMGVGISGSIFQNVMKSKLSDLGLSTDIATNAEAYLVILSRMPDSPARRTTIDAYVAGFHGVYGFLTAISGVALILGLFVKHHEINREHITVHKIDQSARASWRFSRSSAAPLKTPPIGASRESLGVSASLPRTADNSASHSQERLPLQEV